MSRAFMMDRFFAQLHLADASTVEQPGPRAEAFPSPRARWADLVVSSPSSTTTSWNTARVSEQAHRGDSPVIHPNWAAGATFLEDLPPYAPRLQPQFAPLWPTGLQLLARHRASRRVQAPSPVGPFGEELPQDRAQRSTLAPGMSPHLRWLILRLWIWGQGVYHSPLLLLAILASFVYLSLFGGARWSLLEDLRSLLNTHLPPTAPLPTWIRRMLRWRAI